MTMTNSKVHAGSSAERTAAISATRKRSVYCAGTGSSHLFIDVGGYYL
jgi:hypothetical protein